MYIVAALHVFFFPFLFCVCVYVCMFVHMHLYECVCVCENMGDFMGYHKISSTRLLLPHPAHWTCWTWQHI